VKTPFSNDLHHLGRRGGKSAPASSERGGRVQDDSSVEEDSDETSSDSSEDEDVKPRGKATRSVIHEVRRDRLCASRRCLRSKTCFRQRGGMFERTTR